jgi:hypothetical protein
MEEGSVPLESRPEVHPKRVEARPAWFTVEQANRTLPLVSRIVSDIVRHYRELSRLQNKRTALLDQGHRTAAKGIERRGSMVVGRLNELIDELGTVGCELKDVQAGLVDFRGRRDGRDILFCWKLGEPQVRWWHEVLAGTAGRRPIDKACE